METLGILAATIGLFISAAAIIYPFKPFKTRRVAFFSTAMCFLAGVLITINAVDNAIQRPTGEVRERAQLKESDGNSQPATAGDTSPETVRKYFEEGQWHKVIFEISNLRKSGTDVESLVVELEGKTLEAVRPIPASNFERNLAGYELLAALRPDNTTYAGKVDEYRERKRKARQGAVAKLRRKVDKVEGVTWYSHPNKPRHINSRSTVYLYIGQKGENGKPWLRMTTVYTASDWLFVNNVIAWFDGAKVPFVAGRFDRDNNTTIWEWRDESPSDYQLLTLKALSDAKEAILRFEGTQYRKDVTLSAGDKKAIREVLLAFDVMLSGE